jgi:hypothetical protein
MQARPPLIVDSDVPFLDTIRNDPRAARHPPVIATTAREAQLQLANPKLGLAGVFVSLKLENGLSVVRAAH